LDSMQRERQSRAVDSPREEAIKRLQVLLGLGTDRAEQAVAEVLDCMRLSVDEYIRARHGVLQSQGFGNPDIYERIASELPALRFAGPALSARQIRRRIYG
ncbi:MAG: hypothetical protein JWN48_1763, partial [Myxococcaceae bacterium]|nr:hypothetical protein [Myxococcaceae bacterium]